MVKEVADFVFGKNQKERFRRVLIFVGVIAGSIILLQNLTCGYNKKTGVYFRWSPAAEIKIEKKL